MAMHILNVSLHQPECLSYCVYALARPWRTAGLCCSGLCCIQSVLRCILKKKIPSLIKSSLHQPLYERLVLCLLLQTYNMEPTPKDRIVAMQKIKHVKSRIVVSGCSQ